MVFHTWIALRFSPTSSCILSEEQKGWCVKEENASTRSICSQVCNKYQACVGKGAFAVEYLRIEDQSSLIVWATHTNIRAYIKQNCQYNEKFSVTYKGIK